MGQEPLAKLQECGLVQSHVLNGQHDAVAVLKADASVITWGSKECGGDSSLVRSQLLDGVQCLRSTDTAFAAVKKDGTVVLWGLEDNLEAARKMTLIERS